MPSERISFTSTLNDSGMPASISCSPLTMFSYTLVRPLHVVRLDGQHLLQRVRRAVGFQRPHFHLAEALAAELRLAAQRLLRDERVRAGRARVHLVVDQVVQLQHVHVADGDRALERFAGAAVVQRDLVRGQALAASRPDASSSMPRDLALRPRRRTPASRTARRPSGCRASSRISSSVSLSRSSCLPARCRSASRNLRSSAAFGLRLAASRRCCRPRPFAAQPRCVFEHLADVHPRRHAQRIQHDVDRRAVGHVRHVLDRHDLRDHALVAVAAGHLVARLQAALDGEVDLDHLQHARRQLVALRELLALLFEREVELVALLRRATPSSPRAASATSSFGQADVEPVVAARRSSR